MASAARNRNVARAPAGASSTNAGDEAVTPLIGTVLMLAITAIAIVVILLFGTPVLQRLQDQAALQTMAGQFQDIRTASLNLGAADSQRDLPIRLPTGSVDVVDGGSFMVTIDHDVAPYTACDFHVTGWEVPAATQIEFSTVGCRPPVAVAITDPIDLPLGLPQITSCGTGTSSCFEGYEVAGPSMTVIAGGTYTASGTSGTATYLPSGLDSNKDYLFRLTNGGTTVYAQTWLMRTEMVHWHTETSATSSALDFVGGAILSTSRGAIQLPASPALSDGQPSAPGPVYLKFVTLTGTGTGINDRADHGLHLGSNFTLLRTAVTANLVRYDFDGPMEQPWCTGLDLRDSSNPSNDYRYTQSDPADPTKDCTFDAAGLNVVRSILYQPAAPFSLTFLHADLRATIHA